MHSLNHQRREEALFDRVIPNLPSTAHAAGNVLGCQQLLEVFARKLAALIRMLQQFLGLHPAPHGHHQRVSHQLRCHAWLHRPPHDAPRGQVQHYCHIQSTLRRPDVGAVCNAFLFGCVSMKLAIKCAVRNYAALPSVCWQSSSPSLDLRACARISRSTR